MRQLVLTQISNEYGYTPGEFRLLDKETGEQIQIGNYLEVVLHRKLGVVGSTQTPGGRQDIRGYELVIHHSAIHGDGPWEKILPPEMVHYACGARTVDNLLRDQDEGAQLNLRPVLMHAELGRRYTKDGRTIAGKQCHWYIIAVDGVYRDQNGIEFVPHNPLLQQ